MEKDELLVRELSELIGVELSYSDDKTCDLAVDGRIVVLRYRPDDAKADAETAIKFGADPERIKKLL